MATAACHRTPCDVEACKKRYQPDRCADARSPWARQPRTATGILSRVAWCIRCLLPLLSQPSSALLSQKGTHAVWPPFMGDPRRIDNFPFFGRGPLHGRRSQEGSKGVHSAPARAPSRQRTCPYLQSCVLVHRRSYFGWAPSSMRSRSTCPTGTGTCD